MSAAADRLRPVTDFWWLILLDALISAVVGILLLVWPDRTLALAASLAGICLVLIGLVQIARATLDGGFSRGEQIAAGFMAVVALAAGAFLLARPEDTVRAVAIAVGAFLIVSGVVTGMGGASSGARGLAFLTAAVEIGIGIAIVAWPDETVTVYATLTGIYLLVRALLKAALAFSLRSSAET
jgi:uncharacterized membrane protein HdeD (DUF308 family)